MTNFYTRITGSELQGDGATVVQALGTLTVDSAGHLAVHDGTTPGGVPVGEGNYGNSNVTALLSSLSSSLTWTGGSTIFEDTVLVLQGAVAVGITSPGWTEITAGTQLWTFDTEGNLSIPNSINYTNGVSILSGLGAGNYGDANVTAYLAANNIAISDNTLTGTGIDVILTANTANWTFYANGNLEFPSGSTINDYTSRLELQPSGGGDPNQKLAIYPTGGEGNHIHLTSGDLSVTDLFLGSDSQYIRTRTDGGMSIGTSGGEFFGGNTWTFGADGSTQFPNSLILAPDNQSITMQSTQYTQLMWVNGDQTPSPNKSTNSDFYVENGNATLDIGYLDGDEVQQYKSWYWNLDGSYVLPGDVNAPEGTVTAQNFAGNGSQLTGLLLNQLGDVNIVAPTNGQVLKYDANFNHWTNATANGGGGNSGGISLSDLSASVDDEVEFGGNFTYNNMTGVFTYTRPNLTIYSTVANAAAQQTQINSLLASTYSNANVSAYLISQNISSYSNANVSAYLASQSISSYSNANVSAYLASQSISSYSNANVSAYLISQNISSYSNANVSAYLTSQGIAAQVQTDWNQSNIANVAYIKNKPSNVSAFTNDSGYLTNATLANTTTIIQTANVAYYPNVTATTSSATHYVELASAASGNLQTQTSANLTYQPSTGNLTAAGSLIATGNVHANGGHFRTSNATAYLAHTTPTTVYLAGNATIGTYIGNTAGVTQLYGNVQGSTNGFAIGYRDIPQISFSGNTTISLADAGKHYYSTQSTNYTLTVANSATVNYSIGAAINIINQGTGTITIAPAAGVTMYLAGNATSGSRTLASYGMATIQKVAADTWFTVGVGLS